MILLIDNYDSFTYNLYQSVAAMGVEVCVHRNDAKSVAEFLELQPSAVILSPGPGRPENSGCCPELLQKMPKDLPLLGVCLGHQALVESCGGVLELDPIPTHGKSSLVHHDGSLLFKSLPSPFPAGRYHSIRAKRMELPKELRLSAWTEDGMVMGVEHIELPRYGVQFHPESILTPQGDRLMANFLSAAGQAVATR